MNRLAKERDPRREQAYEIFKKHDGNIKNREIANMLNSPERSISGWKYKDKWLDRLNGVLQTDEQSTSKERTKRVKTTKRNNSIRSKQKQSVIDSLVEAGTYSPALDLLIEIYLDAFEEYSENKSEKLRKELAKLLGQLGLDGKNRDLIKKSGRLLGKEEVVKKEEQKEEVNENSKLLAFRKRMSR